MPEHDKRMESIAMFAPPPAGTAARESWDKRIDSLPLAGVPRFLPRATIFGYNRQVVHEARGFGHRL